MKIQSRSSWIFTQLSTLLQRFWLPLLVLLVLGLSYGVQIGQLGFYLDDWIILEAYLMGGAERLAQYTFLGNRPLIFPFWLLGFSLAGSDPAAWQAWSLLWRAASAITLWAGWRCLFPNQTRAMGLAALLFVVYPIFDQQPSALTYSFHWITFTLWAFSFYLMLRAADSPRRWQGFTVAGILLFGLQIFAQEFFIGLEILRPFALWWMHKGKDHRLRKTLLQALPWLVVLGVYLSWRLIWMPTPPSGDRNTPLVALRLLSSPLPTLLTLANMTAQSLIEGLAGVWYKAIDPQTFVIAPKAEFLSWLSAAGLFAASVLILWRQPKLEETPGSSWAPIFAFGMLFFLGGIAPGLSKGSYFTPINPTSDRFALAAMPGAALLITAAIWYLFRTEKHKILALFLLISLAVGFHFRVANAYRYSWEKQLRLYWQLAWRAPQVLPQTAFAGNGALALGMGGWANASALNLLYGDYGNTPEVPYWYIDLYRTTPGSHTQPAQFGSAQLKFTWNPRQSIVFQYEPAISPCLWIVDRSDRANPDLESYVREALDYSDPSRIQADGSNPPPALFGKELSHRWWCYYFQRAELAEQREDWEQTIHLYEQAISQRLKPYHSSEYLPFIRAAVMLSRWEQARQLTSQAALLTDSTSQICETWQDLHDQSRLSGDLRDVLVEQFRCTNLK